MKINVKTRRSISVQEVRTISFRDVTTIAWKEVRGLNAAGDNIKVKRV